ncbi:MAG: nucleotide exchange factor GrpE [Candidatus Vogelbacteria bacterium]|nr:nucleotide exchange factor GrpE [Candidatus Vogelbacteria bacterium]
MSDESSEQNIDNSEDEIVIDGDGFELSQEGSTLDFQEKVNKLKKKLKDTIKEKDEYLNGWQRCRADFVNAKRSEERDRIGLVNSVNESIIRDLLPVLDSFDLAIQDNDKMDGVPEGWRQGFVGIYFKLLDSLGRRGLKQIGVVGEKYDINRHQPVAMVDVNKVELDDTVTEVFQKGYMLSERVVRPAKVKVGQFKRSE